MTVYAENEGYLKIKVESSYGVDPTLAVPTNLLYVDAASIEAAPEVIQREGMSPYARGFRPVKGADNVTVSLTCELTLTTIATGTDRPVEDPVLRACGFTAVASSPTNNEVVVYTARSFGATDSVTIEIDEHNQSNDDGVEHQARGVRGDWTIRLNPAERWTLEMSGMGSAYAHTRLNTARNTAVDYALPVPSVSGGAACSVERLDTDGSTLETYPAAGRVVSLEVTGNNGAQLQRGVCGQRVDFVPSTGPTGTLVVEVVDLDAFDPWASIEEASLIAISISSPAAQAANTADGNYHTLTWTCYVESISVGADAGAKTYSLSLINGYADAAGDGGGLDPDDTFRFTYGTYTAP